MPLAPRSRACRSGVTSPFTGKTLAFLRALKRNNDREWFKARKPEYEQHVRGPIVELLARLSDDFPRFAPELVSEPRVSLYRIYRDTRFSEDKTPLKTHVGATMPHRRLGKMNGAGLYFEVAPGWVWIGGGLWRPDTSQLQLVRELVADRHRELDKIVNSPGIKKLGGLQGDRMTRVPRGFPKDHPAAHYLQFRQFMVFREEPAAFAHSTRFYQQLRWTFETIMPLLTFLNEPLIAAEQPARRAHFLADALDIA